MRSSNFSGKKKKRDPPFFLVKKKYKNQQKAANWNKYSGVNIVQVKNKLHYLMG